MKKIIIFQSLFLTFAASLSFGIGLGFSSLISFAGSSLPMIEYRNSSGECTKVVSTDPFFTHELVENIVTRNLSQGKVNLNESENISVYLENKNCIENNLEKSVECRKTTFLGALYPVLISEHKFYFTARHIFAGKSELGRVVFDEKLNLNDYLIIELQGNGKEINSDLYEDLLVFVPNQFVTSKCSPSSNNIDLESSCYEKIRKVLTHSFVDPKVKSFWVGLQPVQNDNSHVRFQYSAGNIESTDLISDKILKESSHQLDYLRNYFSLVKNVSNHSEAGASGSLIRNFNISCYENNKGIGKPVGIVLCNWTTEKQVTYSLGLNIHKALNTSWDLKTIELNLLLQQKEQSVPFDQLNLWSGDCIPIDGRGAGGPGA